MLLRKDQSKPNSPLKSLKFCENCSETSLKLAEIEGEAKSERETRKKLEVELEHSKAIQEQQKLLFEKQLRGLKDCSEKQVNESYREKEINSLKSEVQQRDSLLTKAKKIVSSLNSELSLKFQEIEELKLINSELLAEIEKLKKGLKELESQKEQKNESFSFDTESFSSKVIKNADPSQRLENDLNFITNQLENTQNSLKAFSEENEKLKKYVSSLELKCENLTKELAENSSKIISLESELNSKTQDIDRAKSSRNSLNNEDFKIFNKEMVSEITSQVLRKTHRRHRHSSNIREVYEVLEAVKGEIRNGNGNCFGFSKEGVTIFKDFQCWYRSHKFDPRNKFLSEVLVVMVSCAKGDVKELMEDLANRFCEIDPEQVQTKILRGIKASFLMKSEALGRIKGLVGNFIMGVESIELVCKRIEELRISLREGGLEKVIELAVVFLKGFAKERQEDCEMISELLKSIM